MSGYKMCLAGSAIYEAQRTVIHLRHLGSRLYMARSLPTLGGQALGLQRDMLRLADGLESLARQIRDEVSKVVIQL